MRSLNFKDIFHGSSTAEFFPDEHGNAASVAAIKTAEEDKDEKAVEGPAKVGF